MNFIINLEKEENIITSGHLDFYGLLITKGKDLQK